MREPTEHVFQTHDGTSLFYRCWPATLAATAPKAVLMLHRGHEHSGRLQHLVDELNLPDFSFFAWDARGHGRSPGVRGFSPSFTCSVRDVEVFVQHIVASHGVAKADIAVLAQSVGAVLAATWAHDYAPQVRCLSLASPAFQIKLYVPLALPGLRLWQKLRGPFFVTSYVKAKLLTHDPQRIASFEQDPLIARDIAAHMLLGLHDAAARVVRDAQAITLPTQLLVSGADWVVRKPVQHRFFQRLGSAVKEKIELPGFYHDTLGERDRAPAVAAVRDFIVRQFVAPPVPASLLEADQHGVWRDEELALQQTLGPLSLKGWSFAVTRCMLATLGRCANGIQLGHQTGFDSGATLDYVYRNQAQGRWGIGRLFDRSYLDSIGWRGIRVRKQHLQELIQAAAQRLLAAGQPLHVVDLAAGHGRYTLEAVAAMPVAPASLLLRDFVAANVESGRALIAAMGLQALARFEPGDAFDAASVAALQPAPTLAVVSGLYELFPSNTLVRQSLSGLAQALPSGGYLVYTGQPWHPQLELIARTLTSHRGGSNWVMRRRSQAEMDQLVEAAGFEKIEQRIDEWGIFSVSLARRR